MPQPPALPDDGGAALAVERDRVIERLSRHFALDEISLEELDARIERAYRARSLAELATITADLTTPTGQLALTGHFPVSGAGHPGALVEHEAQGRLLSLMSSITRVGPWVVPRNLEMVAVMSETKLDLRQALLAPGVTDIQIFALWAAIRIAVPPGVRVIDDTSPIMAEVKNESLEDAETFASPGPCIVRLRGTVIMSELKVRTRAIGSTKKW